MSWHSSVGEPGYAALRCLCSDVWFGFALAHQGHFSVDDLEFTEVGGVRFLAMRVAYEEHDAPLKLSAVLVDGEAAVLPPAVSTALSFALRPGDESNLLLFVLALGITVSRCCSWGSIG